MKVTQDHIYTRVTRSLNTVEGSEPMILPMMYGNKPGRVGSVIITYTLGEDAKEWGCNSVILGGAALKQDGSDSKNTFSQRVSTYDLKHRPEGWEWLLDLIEQARPTSSPVFPSSFEGREFSAT